MHKTNAFTLLKCIVFSVVWTCCLGERKAEVPVLRGFGLVGEVFLLWQAAKPSGDVEVLRLVEVLRW